MYAIRSYYEDLRHYRTTVQAVFQDPWSSLSPRMRVRDIVAEPLVVNQKVSDQEVSYNFV